MTLSDQVASMWIINYGAGGGGEVESAGFQVRDDSTLDLGSGDEGAENLPDPRLNIRVIQFLKMQLKDPFPCACAMFIQFPTDVFQICLE